MQPVVQPFDLATLIQHAVMGQPRTGAHRQFVAFWQYVNGQIGDLVLKGPYTNNGLIILRQRRHFLTQWQTPYVVLATDEILSTDGGQYLVYPNLCQHYPITSETHQERFSDCPHKHQYQVLNRVGLIKLGKYMQEHILPAHWFPNLLLALCELYMLDVGDMHPHNIMVDINDLSRPYIIDYDHNAQAIRENETFYFAPHVKYSNAQLWLDTVQPHYPAVIDLIAAKDYDVYATKAEHVRELLAQYIAHPTEPVKSKIKFSGSARATSISTKGHTDKVLRSALQKSVRRNMVDMALMVVFEFLRFADVGGSLLVSNMLNRLMIIAAEDIGVANVSLVINVINFHQVNNRDPVQITNVVLALCASTKTRIGSHAYRTYATTTGIDYARSLGITTETGLPEELPTLDIWLADDPSEIKPIAAAFALRLSEGSMLAFTWAATFLEVSEGQKYGLRQRRRQPVMILWQILAAFLPAEIVKPLQYAYFKCLKDARCFMSMAILCVIYDQNVVEHVDFTAPQDISRLVAGDYELVIDQHFILDMHTPPGRSVGRDRDHFVREGAKVENQDMRFYDALLEQVYIHG